MSQNLQTFTRALHMLRSVGNRVPDGAWDNQSCCSDWTARQVAGHACWVVQGIGATAAGTPGPAKQTEADVAGDDPGETIRRSVDATLAALDQPDVLHTIAQTPFGEMPIDDFIGAIFVDPLTHAWDIADATGIDHGIDAATAEAGLAALQPIAGIIRGPGMFADEVDAHSDDAVSKLMAFAGRTSVSA